MRFLFALATAVVAALTAPATAGADPTPAPSPGYKIQTRNGPVIGGLPNLPAICAVQPRACALNYDPNTGAWERPGTDPN